MNKIRLLFYLIISCTPFLQAQTTLFNQKYVHSVFIELPADSLQYMMVNVLSEHWVKSRFIYDYITGKDTLEDIGFRLRGNTSRFSKKKSFKVSFNEYVPGRKYEEVKKLNFNGQHNDPTMVREKFFYDTWERTGMPERRTSFVKLYINNVYRGLYTMLEELDKQWLDRVYGENAGNLYKCTYPAGLEYIGNVQQIYKNIQSTSATGGRAYDLQTNETTDNYSDLVNLISTLNLPVDSAFVVSISQLLDVNMALKAFALDVATGNWDGYMYNKNNYYLYHRTDGRFEYIAYDTDNTFGVDWVNVDWVNRNCYRWYYQDDPRPLASKLLSVPSFRDRYTFYLDSITRYILCPDSVFPDLDAMRDQIYYAAQDDAYRRLDFNYNMGSFISGFIETVDYHTPYGIKPFLSLRGVKTLQQLQSNSSPEILKKDILSFTLYPNPAESSITVCKPAGGKQTKGRITDSMGKLWKEFIWSTHDNTLSLAVDDLPIGAYTLIMESSAAIGSQRFIKQ